jgi:hypothetical protein
MQGCKKCCNYAQKCYINNAVQTPVTRLKILFLQKPFI